MPDTVIAKINKLRTMPVGELRDEWFKLYGETTRSRNRQYLWRRLAWRVQELAYGGLSDRAKARLEELATDEFRRARTPGSTIPGPASTRPTTSKHRRDPRLPPPGTVITKHYKGLAHMHSFLVYYMTNTKIQSTKTQKEQQANTQQ